MKYQSIKKEHKKEHLYFKFVKMLSWIKAHMEINSEKRKQNLETYEFMYEHSSTYRRDNGLEDRDYYVPQAFVVSDIVSKEKLDEVKKGIKLLYKNHLSHKFIGPYRTETDIDNMIKGLDLAISEGCSWYRFEIFDVEDRKKLRGEIAYFDIVVRNFSASFLAIEFYVYFTEEKQIEFDNFSRRDYKSNIKKAIARFSNNQKLSGAKIKYAIGKNVDGQEKNELLYDSIECIKFKFLKLMMKYFPLIICGNGNIPAGILIAKTNIHYSKDMFEFWNSVGVNSIEGVFVNEYVKIFPSTNVSREERNRRTNITLIYNDSTLESPYLEMFHGKKLHFIMDYVFESLQEVYKVLIIDNISEYYNKKCATYRNQINKSSVKKWAYPFLLKLRYKFDVDFSLMDIIKKEVNFEEVIKSAEAFFVRECMTEFDKYESYKCMSTYPIKQFDIYVQNRQLMELSLGNKIKLSGDLRQYSNEKRSWKINLVTFVIVIGTFVFLIFPEWASVLASFLKEVYKLLFS